MRTQKAYCSACDKDVEIVVTDEPSQEGHANVFDSEIVCLEIGEGCTGHLCPVGATSPTVMAARLVRNGLQTVLHPIVSARCPGCGRTTSHVIVEKTHATCADCGTITPRSELSVESS